LAKWINLSGESAVDTANPNGSFGNREEWHKNPVKLWHETFRLERILPRHPDLVVDAQCSWHIFQAGQTDVLRHMLTTCPIFYICSN
jgi:hypothetical protein